MIMTTPVTVLKPDIRCQVTNYSVISLVSRFRLFEKCPKAKPMFGYDLLADVDEEFMSDPKFVAHSVQLIGTLIPVSNLCERTLIN